jgi:integrase/recombinase XerD
MPKTMQKLNLKNESYQYLQLAFKEWLDVLGYGKDTVKSMSIILKEFLYYLDRQGVSHITELQQKQIKAYHGYIHTRANERRGGGLSNNYINKHLQAIEKFLEFLNHKGMPHVPALGIRLEKLNRKEITILTQDEIKELFEITSREASTEREQVLQSRDKALLVIYYSCGLRRNEGVNVNIEDINLDTRILHVKKGKNYKERLVPFNKTNAAYLQEWIYDYRSQLIKTGKQSRLFVNILGEPMTGGTLYKRLKLLQLQSENVSLHQKEIGIHALRHSIATHLLASGMSMEKIAKFLGHSSLESTQIYTHLIQKDHGTEQF